nr:heavy metal translocating P-type ATPase metal-binding domain-containing protein [Pseudomonadota bacterium]
MSVVYPVAAVQEQVCFHCGLPVPNGAGYTVTIDGAAQPMCCRGCEAVAAAIVAAGLEDFYRHRRGPSKRGDGLPADVLRQLALYDRPEVQLRFVRAEGELREASLILEGIDCAACAWLNERHVGALPGVAAFHLNYSTHRALVAWDPQQTRLSDILEAIAAIGYRAHPYDPRRQESVQRQ